MNTATQVFPFVNARPPAWADGWGQDEYGFYAEFSIETGDRYWDFVKQRMRWIPPGTFLMGSPENEPEREADEVQHQVTLSEGFWLADTTCTQELWQAVMKKNPSSLKGEQRPVECVSWDDAHRFLDRVNQLIPDLQLQLPTEVQWEYACRAGTTTPFSTGENITTDQVNYNSSYPYADAPKGQYRGETIECTALPPNPWGLYQMHGNVWEWCEDRYGNYEPQLQVEPCGPENGSARVVRGGRWFNDAHDVRSSYRHRFAPGFRNQFLGFRCLSSVSPEPDRPRRAE